VEPKRNDLRSSGSNESVGYQQQAHVKSEGRSTEYVIEYFRPGLATVYPTRDRWVIGETRIMKNEMTCDVITPEHMDVM
jgi:hypothetical protein